MHSIQGGNHPGWSSSHMVMYAKATLPLIQSLQQEVEVEQIWFADDSALGGMWTNSIIGGIRLHVQKGPALGYYANPKKTWLVLKEDQHENAVKCFEDTDVRSPQVCKGYWGSPLGASSFKKTYFQLKVDKLKEKFQSLVEIAATQPQVIYAALIISINNKWSYLVRTTETIGHLLQPIEDVLRHDLIPAITGRQEERRMFALPTRLGGLGIEILPEVADQLYSNSRKVTEPLKNSICGREKMDESHTDAELSRLSREVKNDNKEMHRRRAEGVYKEVTANGRKALSSAEQKGSFSLLSTLPVEENGFALHKGAFRDAIALRYRWQPTEMPSLCDCSKANGVEHVLLQRGPCD